MSESDKTPLSTESYKGVRDFYPEDMFIENYIFDVWRKACESFGYAEYNASILEPSELYRAKSSEEIVSEQTYSFRDRGDREVTLRPEMTPTVARMIAGRKRDLKFPVRWFSIANVFRYERPQKGRLREHFQLNADIFGAESQEADIEIIELAHAVLKRFGLSDSQFTIKVNDKVHVRKILLNLGLSPEKTKEAQTLLDKRNKLDTFDEEWGKLVGSPFDESIFENNELSTFVSLLRERGIEAEADPLLVRGFDYYSGIVFEIFDTNKENRRSLFGGGRYDGLTELFGENNIPAVGFGMGDVTIRDTLEAYKLLPQYEPSADLYICVLAEDLALRASTLAVKLREKGLKVAVDVSYRKLGDQIEKADKDGIPFVLPYGEDEAKSGHFKLKELKSGKETEGSADKIAALIRG